MKFMRLIVLLILTSALAFVASAATVTFPVSIDTGLLSGTDGALYMIFSPGLDSDPAIATVNGFTIEGPGVLTGTPQTLGDVSGSLPGDVTFANTDAANDYLHFLAFGSTLRFNVHLDVPSPLSGPSGSQFSFGLTGPDGLSPLLSQDPSGFLGIIAYDHTGQITATSLDPSTLIGIPEPSTGFLCVPAALALLAARIRRRSQL